MAGWPFDDFALNPKCAALSTFLVGGYFYLPCKYDRHAWRTAALIAVGSYTALAWYDYAYACEMKMRPGALSVLTSPLKPPVGVDGTYGGD